MKNLLTLALVIMTIGCGESDDGPPKDLFSVWMEESSGGEFDFTAGDFGMAFPIVLTFPGGAQCNCQMTFLGDQSAGTWDLDVCVYEIGTGTAFGQPTCDFAEGAGPYTKSTNVLRLEDPFGFFNLYR